LCREGGKRRGDGAQMTLEAETLVFLEKEFPSTNKGELEAAFGWIYEEGSFGTEETAEERRTRRNKIQAAIEELTTLSGDGWKAEAEEIVNDRSRKAKAVGIEALTADDPTPNSVADELSNYLDCVEIWHRNHPKTGGKRVVADLIAQAVKDVFCNLGRRATFGQSPDGKSPSTSYGRVVEDVLDFHGDPTHWRRPTQRHADAG